jgi:Mrp family chromosome partitioning ATPase
MIDKQKIIESIALIPVPGTQRNIVKMNLIRSIDITDNNISIEIANTTLEPQVQDLLKDQIIKVIQKNLGVKDVEVHFTTIAPKDLNEIKHVIAIMSGKGGVGKSLVTSLTSIALKRQGFEVGILDADITGPSIPMMFGINKRPSGNETGIMPVSSKTGIEVMSINLLIPNEDDAVIWRGPLIGSAIKQFWEEVLWGKLDYLIVDLPPGTADAPLTVMQSLPIAGVVIVFTPQELTGMVVRKAVKMAQQMKKPILGIIENMSYLYLPDLDRKMEIFGKSRATEMERASGAPLLAQLPINPELASLCDTGRIEQYNSEDVQQLGKRLLEAMTTIAPNTKDDKTK